MSISYLNDLNSEQVKLAPKFGGNHLPHNCIVRLNLYNLNDGIDFREFPLKCGYPQPIYMEEEEYSSLFNHPHSLVRQKQNYKERLAQFKKKIVGKRNKKKLEVKLGRATYGGNFQLFVELLKQDPDKYFDGPYDWYYTGGSLTHSPHDNIDQIILLSVTGKNLDKMRVSQRSNKHSNIIDLDKNAGIIYETNNYKGNYTVRQKNRITGFCHGDTEDSLDLHEHFAIDSKVPLLSSAFVTDCKIVTIDAGQIIKLWDIETMCSDRFKKFDIKRKIDNWGYLNTFNEPLVLYSNRSEFHILDYRVPDYKTIGTYIYENSYECNKIYGMANSKFDNLVYLSVNHAIYGLDIRCLAEQLSMTTVSKWTHQMKLPPIMIDTVLYNGDEYIYLSSSLKDNKKICVNRKNTVYSSPYLPYTPKSMEDTYRQVRLLGNCIDPISDFGERINLCTTGIGIFVNNNVLHTIVSNAGGDIFHQKFEDNEHDVSAETIENMELWVKYLRSNRCSKITNMDRMNSILLAMQCKRLSLATETVEDNDLTAEDCRRRKPKWQRTVNELYQYKDVLARNILDAWDVGTCVGHTCTEIQLESQINTDTSELPYTSKIDDWFTRNDEIEPSSYFTTKIEDGVDNNIVPDSFISSQIAPETSTQIEVVDMSQIFKTKRIETGRRKSTRLDGF